MSAAMAHGPPAKRRLVGLDVMRGTTMAVMLVVDVAGDAYPSIGHAPWDGLHLADFVMPYFLLICGISAALSPVRNVQRDWLLGKAVLRSLRLFLLGLAVQGSALHETDAGPLLMFDLAAFRIMGILQRIAIVYLIVTVIALYVTGSRSLGSSAALLGQGQQGGRPDPGLRLLWEARWQWLVVLLVVGAGAVLTYAVKPPTSWPGCASSTLFGPGDPSFLRKMGCSSVGWLDSLILGVNHVYIAGSNVGPTAAANFGFDPEGLVTTLSAVFPMFLGAHVGRASRLLKSPLDVVVHWTILAVLSMAAGAGISAFLPFNKRLWSPSYSLFTSGSGLLLYALLFSICDWLAASPTVRGRLCRCFTSFVAPLQWLGSNCIIFFVFSDCCGVFSWLLQSIAWRQPGGKHNVVYWFRKQLLWCLG